MAKHRSRLNSSRVILLQRLVSNSSSSRALQISGVSLKILLRSKTIFLWGYMEEDLYFPIILMMAPDLQQVTASLPVALVYLKTSVSNDVLLVVVKC